MKSGADTRGENKMRRLVLAIAAAGALAGAAALTAPAIAAPVNSLGALNSAAATLDNVEQAAIVCGRWRCWHTWGGGYYRPHFWGFRRGWRRW
jgi:hypothetical protein